MKVANIGRWIKVLNINPAIFSFRTVGVWKVQIISISYHKISRHEVSKTAFLWCKTKSNANLASNTSDSHPVCSDPYHLHVPWMNLHFLRVFREHDATQKEIERFHAVNVSADWSTLDYLTNCNKRDLEKTIRTNCIYRCSANIIP